ncbi:uncharacterized protein K452DRAFT_303188 [Aplosporella prunicola CBS 121167]|uniref:F-box domain-containing protein n=1 Tax=Aplosporella prunicola CBS 121167 TaxID=1176127 RepID=A0A6A6AW35_9PEZI|nr:uncharacterized protein K452DRAFT_303188 [Aplosporella prunicola CBS 121167]KAF2135910.1 hypothetical protein K452DRAFT_303188 [Aplosporella prunicola CBS 121167]
MAAILLTFTWANPLYFGPQPPTRADYRRAMVAMAYIAPFSRLPPELRLMVAEHMDMSDIAVLTLSHPPLRRIPGFVPILRGDDRFNFLNIILRDLPILYYCADCECFHTSLFGPTCSAYGLPSIAWLRPIAASHCPIVQSFGVTLCPLQFLDAVRRVRQHPINVDEDV